jgi:hypothetical protein
MSQFRQKYLMVPVDLLDLGFLTVLLILEFLVLLKVLEDLAFR